MHDEHPHPLLAQVPLTVSPFLSLPTGTTLPYTYKSLPSTLPPSALDPPPGTDPTSLNTTQTSNTKPAYVMSAGGHSAHPDDIIANCRALQAHLRKLEEDARRMVQEWDDRLKERDLAEKRRVAPGWLDEDVKMLVPERKDEVVIGTQGEAQTMGMQGQVGQQIQSGQMQQVQTQTQTQGPVNSREGEELDRAFGGLDIR